MDDYISREDAVQCAVDIAADLFNDGSYGASSGASTVGVWLKNLPAADVRPAVHAHWNLVGKQMVINLANAREQYSELGYPHRNILQVQCDKCRLITMVDESIRYDYCPHCGADMRDPNLDTTKGKGA